MSLKEAVEVLDDAVGKFLNHETSDYRIVLASIFTLNIEIGKLLRPGGNADLKALQLMVNEVTRAAKKEDRKSLANAMEKVRSEALKMA